MKQNTPFVHLIESPYGYYFYDVGTNKIYRAEENTYMAIKHLKDGKTELLSDEQLESIQEMQESGLLTTKRPSKMKHPASDRMEYYLTNKLEGIQLQITQDCNFRCSYCPYSQEESVGNRKHAKRSMSFETAKKGIDFMIKHSRDSESVHVGFMGVNLFWSSNLLKK